jgi:acylphosphatase
MTGRMGHNRRRVLYSGRVQGVGFRYKAVGIARRFAVQGFVRNLSDGRVELIAEGEPGELDRFMEAVRHAMEDLIQGEQVETSPARDEFAGFEIRFD